MVCCLFLVLLLGVVVLFQIGYYFSDNSEILIENGFRSDDSGGANAFGIVLSWAGILTVGIILWLWIRKKRKDEIKVVPIK